MNGLFGGRQIQTANPMSQAPVNVSAAPARRGLFGGFNPFRFENNGMTGSDRLMTIGAILADMGGGQGNVAAIRNEMTERRARERQQAAQQALTQALGAGMPSSQQGALGQAGGLPSLRAAAPALLQAQAAGIDIGDYVNLLDRAGPDIRTAGNFAYDARDPNNSNRYFPDLQPGEEPLYDGRGQIVGVRNMQGAIQALEERERTTADARNRSAASYAGVQAEAQAAGAGRGAAPYAIETVIGPDGRPVTASRQAILEGGPIFGQSQADQAYAVASANNRAAREDSAETRASAAERLLPSLDRMEQLLPDVIAGAGADQRLLASRALALTGNERAVRESTATQVFQNEARQVVAQIIRAFGANPTEGERRYAEQMSGADVNYTPEALREGIRLARARAQRDMAGAPSAQRQQTTQGPSREDLIAEARRRGLIQ